MWELVLYSDFIEKISLSETRDLQSILGAFLINSDKIIMAPRMISSGSKNPRGAVFRPKIVPSCGIGVKSVLDSRGTRGTCFGASNNSNCSARLEGEVLSRAGCFGVSK